MAKFSGAIVVVVITLVLIDVELLIGFVAAVVVRILITSWRLFKVAIVIIPAMHVATNITNQKTML